MASVTVPGTGSSTIRETFGNQANLQLANQIRDALVIASANNRLNVANALDPAHVPTPPAALAPGGINELVITVGGWYNIPAGDASHPDYVVVLQTIQDVTINGAANTSIWGGAGKLTIVDPAMSTIAEEAGSATVTATGDGEIVAGNNFSDHLTAAGNNESIVGGTGTGNLFLAMGTNDTISANGTNDTVFGMPGTGIVAGANSTNLVYANLGGSNVVSVGGAAGGGSPTVFGSFGAVVGSDTIVAGSGALLVATGNSNDTIFAGTAAGQTILGGYADSGNGANVIHGGTADLEIAVGASKDTIFAGSGNDSIYIGNGNFADDQLINGGTGPLRVQFIGGAGSATVVGGSGAVTVFGIGDSNITWIGGPTGGFLDAVGNVSSTGSYNASASTSNDTLFGQSGNVSITGGSGNDFLVAGVNTGSLGGAGSVVGGSTLSGGAGTDTFIFTSGLVNGGDIIKDFNADDFVALSGYGAGAAATVLANATSAGGTTTLRLSDGTSISFLNTSTAQLTGHVFSN